MTRDGTDTLKLHSCIFISNTKRERTKGCKSVLNMNCQLLILATLGLSTAATTGRFDPFAFFAITSRLDNPNDIWKSIDTGTISGTKLLTKPNQSRDCTPLVQLYSSRHPNELNSTLYNLCQLASSCLDPSEIDKISNELPKGSPSETGPLRMCSLLLTSSNVSNCAGGLSGGKSLPKEVVKSSKETSISAWAIGFLSVTIINMTSVIGIVVVPFLNKSSYLSALNLFEGLAVGSLTGSAIFHLIPQAFDLLTPGNSNHEYLYKSLVVFGGIYLFYWSEKIMTIYAAIKDRSSKKDALQSTNKDTNNTENNQLEVIDSSNDKSSNIDFESRLRSASDSLAQVRHGHHSHDHNIKRRSGEIATVAWMIVFGDGLHNFIDGLSIGAAFNESILTGISICVAVVCEEFPHELGDFAVLIASGMSVRQAVGYNFLSACTCYLGLIIGIWLGDMGPTYIFALAGGMFLYIALVDMMSELTSSVEDALKTSVGQTVKVLFLQNLGILIGILTLFLLAKYSEYIRF